MEDGQQGLPANEHGGPRRHDLGDQHRTDALRADLAGLLARGGDLADVLHQCCRILVEWMDAAFVRIWTLQAEEQTLVLQASAGLYTRLDGSHARIPVGQYKIGLIASQRRPHLTNQVIGDELVHDQAWARREGMTAFAGYPLLADGDLVGVVAMFSRREIAAGEFASLEIIAGTIANYIRRKQSEQAVYESQQRLQLIADSLPVLISYIDDQERYQFNNAAYEQWFGIPRNKLRGRTLCDVLGLAAYTTIREHVTAALAGEPRSFEERVPYHGAGTRDVRVDYVPHRAADGKVAGFFALIIDVSARKRAEEALRDREARLGAILNTAADGIITIDQEGLIESVNPAAERLFGYSATELIGRNVSILMPAPYSQEHGTFLTEYLKTGIKHVIGRERELPARRKDGTVFPIALSVSEVHDGKVWFTGIVHDLSHRKALERQILEVSAQEQQRIAHELHDGVGQELTGLGLMADALAKRLPETSPAEQTLAAKLVQGLERVHQQVRTLCRGLILTELEPDALRMVLEELAETTAQTGVDCRLECPPTIPIPDSQTAKHLYRIVQEAVSNALRHGRPRHIWLSLRSSSAGLKLTVRDDGVGVGERDFGDKGMGIPTMQYRAGMIGGILQIAPGEGGGTIVTCIIPGRKHFGNREDD